MTERIEGNDGKLPVKKLIEHFVVEATAPTAFAEVSRRARGSKLRRVHPVTVWTSSFLDALGAAGYANTQRLEVAVTAHAIAKGVEGANLVFSYASDRLDKFLNDLGKYGGSGGNGPLSR